jgi:ribosome-associated protein
MARQRQIDWDEVDDRPSKTEQKKAMQRLQQLGEQLVGLSEKKLRSIGLEDSLLEEILDYQQLTAHEARRRQMQRIGKLLRHADIPALLGVLGEQQTQRQQNQLARWQERLLEQGDQAVAEFVRQYPAAERHTLRQCVLRYQKSVLQQEPAAAQAELLAQLDTYIQQVALLSG